MPNATALKFGYPDTLIARSGSWLVLLRPKQPTFASLVVVNEEPVRAFSELSVEAFTALKGMTTNIERVLRTFVAYERINYLMYMLVDPDVHFHVIPRYEGTREFAGLNFPDAGWPKPPMLDATVEPDAAQLQALVEQLRRLWNTEA